MGDYVEELFEIMTKALGFTFVKTECAVGWKYEFPEARLKMSGLGVWLYHADYNGDSACYFKDYCSQSPFDFLHMSEYVYKDDYYAGCKKIVKEYRRKKNSMLLRESLIHLNRECLTDYDDVIDMACDSCKVADVIMESADWRSCETVFTDLIENDEIYLCPACESYFLTDGEEDRVLCDECLKERKDGEVQKAC